MIGRAFALRHTATGLVLGAVTIAAVTGVIAALRHVVPVLGLTGLYFFAILPVAIGWGFWLAGLVALASFAVFVYFFEPPFNSFHIAHLDAPTTALVISLLTAYVVSDLARRAQTREREARLRAREAEQAQRELRRVADEQAALRRLATRVARGEPAESVFGAVTEEVGRLLGVDRAALARWETDATVTEVMIWNAGGEPVRAGTRVTLSSRNRADAKAIGAEYARATGLRSSVSAPIAVEGRLWGVMVAGSKSGRGLAADTGAHLAQFTKIAATAVANAEARAELRASRGRIIAAGDETRRRLERAHEGVQQRLVTLALDLRAAGRGLPDDLTALRSSLMQTADGLTELHEELQEIARRLHPAILSKGGLAPAVRMLAARTGMAVAVSVQDEARLPEHLKVAAYHVVAEALENVVDHARATSADVWVHTDDAALLVRVRDDGIGGADPRRGSGLVAHRPHRRARRRDRDHEPAGRRDDAVDQPPAPSRRAALSVTLTPGRVPMLCPSARRALATAAARARGQPSDTDHVISDSS